MQDLYVENLKAIMKEVYEDLHKWSEILPQDWKTYCEVVNSPQFNPRRYVLFLRYQKADTHTHTHTHKGKD